ncbi:MAG: hypothetical protein GXX96_03270 [Planctomycetaceae bacterium]|nr:hypothetical protein [Planctomycetaceae bacterium]
MNPQRTFVRKVVYVVAIGLLLIPLFLLARPASSGRPGGKLAELREAQGLSEAQIGEIDPTSETMKLSTFGMRGVATAILWQKSADYQKKKDWTGLAATLNQIIRLEPHFISVWKFQSWNMAYNVSAEFDDYRERYRWVIKGIEFLIQGISYNARNPVLHCGVGWDIAQKIGTADEKVQFRKLFKADDEFHNKYRTPSYEERDNWLVGKSWYVKAEKLVQEGESIGNMGENIFYARRPKCQMEFARNIEEDGEYFGEKAGENWALAHAEWTEDFGARPIRTTYRDDNDEIVKIVLNDYTELSQELKIFQDELEALEVGLRDRLLRERWAKLDEDDRNCWRYVASSNTSWSEMKSLAEQLDRLEPGWRDTSVDLVRSQITKQQAAALEVPAALRTSREVPLAEQANRTIGEGAYRAQEAMNIELEDLAREMQGEKRREAFKLVEKAREIERQRRIIGSYRGTINYEEWEFRSRYEQLPVTLTAREYVFKGRQALADGLLPEAQDHFRKGLAAWGELLSRDDCKRLIDDRDTTEDLRKIINSYVSMLEQRDELFPEDFPLAAFYANLAAKDEIEGGMTKAREAGKYAAEAFAKGDTQKAIASYTSSIDAWATTLQTHRALALMINRGVGKEILDTIEGYASALLKDGQTVPPDYALGGFFHLQMTHAPELSEAQKLMAQAGRHVSNSEYPEAQKLLEESMQKWRALLDRYPCLAAEADPFIADGIREAISAYRKVLELRGKEFPEDFLLKDFVEKTEKKA